MPVESDIQQRRVLGICPRLPVLHYLPDLQSLTIHRLSNRTIGQLEFFFFNLQIYEIILVSILEENHPTKSLILKQKISPPLRLLIKKFIFFRTLFHVDDDDARLTTITLRMVLICNSSESRKSSSWLSAGRISVRDLRKSSENRCTKCITSFVEEQLWRGVALG